MNTTTKTAPSIQKALIKHPFEGQPDEATPSTGSVDVRPRDIDDETTHPTDTSDAGSDSDIETTDDSATGELSEQASSLTEAENAVALKAPVASNSVPYWAAGIAAAAVGAAAGLKGSSGNKEPDRPVVERPTDQGSGTTKPDDHMDGSTDQRPGDSSAGSGTGSGSGSGAGSDSGSDVEQPTGQGSDTTKPDDHVDGSTEQRPGDSSAGSDTGSGSDQNGTDSETDKVVRPPVVSIGNGAHGSGTGQPGDPIIINGSVSIEIHGLQPDADWSFSTDNGVTWHPGLGNQIDASQIPEGAQTIQVVQIDGMGQTSAPATIDLVKDIRAEAPLLSVENVAALDASGMPIITASGAISVTGLEAGGQWLYSLDNGVSFHLGQGASINSTLLAEGTNTVLVKQIDAVDNESSTASIVLSKDTLSLAPTAITYESLRLNDYPSITTQPLSGVQRLSDIDWANSKFNINLNLYDDPLVVAGKVRLVESIGTDQMTILIGGTDGANGFSVTLMLSENAGGGVSISAINTQRATGNWHDGANWIDWPAYAPSYPPAESPGKLGANLQDIHLQVKNPAGILSTGGLIHITGLEDGACWQYRYADDTPWLDGVGAYISASDVPQSTSGVQIRQIDKVGNISSITSVAMHSTDSQAPAASAFGMPSPSHDHADASVALSSLLGDGSTLLSHGPGGDNGNGNGSSDAAAVQLLSSGMLLPVDTHAVIQSPL